MFGATDWALKRVFKFLLKRHLGRLLRSEVDLEQLDVQLGRGTLELRSVLLNCDSLNEQLVGPRMCSCSAATALLDSLARVAAQLRQPQRTAGRPCAFASTALVTLRSVCTKGLACCSLRGGGQQDAQFGLPTATGYKCRLMHSLCMWDLHPLYFRR